MDEDKIYRINFLKDRFYMDEHMKWLINRLAEAYEQDFPEKVELYKKNIINLRAVMNSRDRILSEDQKFYVLNFY